MGLDLKEVTETLVASPPAVYLQLKKALDNPDSNFVDFGKIISNDPALAARLLKIVNSAFYGMETKVDTITHALNIIGIDQLTELALATSVMTQFHGIPQDLINVKQFWKHSVACGIAARRVAKYKQAKNPERFYLAGMLHDIGKLVVFKEAPSKAKEVLAEYYRLGDKHLLEVEKDVLGFNHMEVGAVLLKEWQLPTSLVEAVAVHHTPLKAKKYQAEAAIVHVADFLVYEMELGSSGEPSLPKLEPKVIKVLNLTEEFIRDIKPGIQEQTELAVDMFV